MTDHTPKPYCATYTDLPYGKDMSEGWTVDGPEGSVCTLDCPLEDREAMAKRIAAALNACAGIPTEQLKTGSVARLLKVSSLITVGRASIEDLLAALAPFRRG